MRRSSKLLLTALIAAMALGALVATTSASRLALSNTLFRVTWSGLEFEFPSAGVTIKCPVTLEGSFHSRTLPKVLEALIGYVTSVQSNEQRCTGGSVRVLTAFLPWHIRYNGFSGTLPTITKIHFRIVGAEYLMQTAFPVFRCLYRSTATSPLRGWINRNAEGPATTVVFDRTALIRVWMELPNSAQCPPEGILKENSGGITVQNATTLVTVTLVVLR